MNKLSIEKRAEVIKLLCEGTSIRGACRITGRPLNTVLKLVVDLGKVCLRYHEEITIHLTPRFLQCDEVWSFFGRRPRYNTSSKTEDGAAWTWVAIDPDTRYVIAYETGGREQFTAMMFLGKIERALKKGHRFQLTTDAWSAYRDAIYYTFDVDNLDYARINKTIDKKGKLVSIVPEVIYGNPDFDKICTSHVERQNLTLRMHSKRFTRKTNAFSKKLDNHAYAVAIHYMYYNFCKIHKTLRCTPAMEIGLTDKIWEVEDIIQLLVDKEIYDILNPDSCI